MNFDLYDAYEWFDPEIGRKARKPATAEEAAYTSLKAAGRAAMSRFGPVHVQIWLAKTYGQRRFSDILRGLWPVVTRELRDAMNKAQLADSLRHSVPHKG